jgi:hypothetical protein
VTTITNANITDRRRSVFVAPTGARNQGLINGKIVPTVASNNLTVAIKTLSDTDPSATNPVGVWIGNQLRWITSALTFTRNGGTSSLNMGSSELATRTVNLFPYIQWNTTTQALNLLASRIPYARKMSDFVNSATDEKGVLNITNYNSGDDVVLLDRFDVVSNGSNNFTSTGNVYGEPIRRTNLLTYTTQFTVAGGGSFTSGIRIQNYEIIENKCFIQWETNAHTISGTVNNITFSLPFVSADEASNGFWFGIMGYEFTGNQIIRGQAANSGAGITFSPTSGNWTIVTATGYLGIKDVYTI